MATDDLTIPQHTPLTEAPRSIPDILAQEQSSQLPYWDSSVAFRLGCALRTRLLTFDRPAVIQISTITTPAHVLFHATTHTGTSPNNDAWVQRKRASVIRFGASTWRLQQEYGGDEALFAAKNGLVGGAAGAYAIHGGGVPVFVRNCSGMVGVVVVSGLKQWDDHQVVVEELGGL
ncbi:hypothetical protein BDW02DRAFT_535915, partial [Decorospora gaudefroyi]